MPKLEKRVYRVSDLKKTSRIPNLSLEKEPPTSKSDIENSEGLFIDYGRRETSYPYTQQKLYSEEKGK